MAGKGGGEVLARLISAETMDHFATIGNNSNHTEYVDSSLIQPSREATAVGAAIMIAFLIEGFLGNLWITAVIISKKALHRVIYIFIVSLCINDVMNLAVNVALIVDSYVNMMWASGETLCLMLPEFSVIFTGTSLWHSAFIGIHRYLVVVHSDFYKRIQLNWKRYVAIVLVLARLIPIACTIPALTTVMSGYVPKLLRCVHLPHYQIRTLVIIIVNFILPCLTVMICYLSIFIFVFRTARLSHERSAGFSHEIQITKMFGVVFLMILIGYIPYVFVRAGDKGGRVLHADVYVIVTVLYAVANCLSPLVYGAMSQEIRIACLQSAHRIQLCLGCKKEEEGYTMPPDQVRVDRQKSIVNGKTSTTNEHSTQQTELSMNSINNTVPEKTEDTQQDSKI